MTSKKIQMQDSKGNIIYPATTSELVTYGSGNVNDTLVDLEARDELFISDTAPDKDGLWVDTSDQNSSPNGENLVVTQVKKYVNENLNKMDKKVETVNSQLNENTNEITDIKNDISTNYAKKTEVNDLASNKADKTALETTNTNVAKNTTDLAVQTARIDSFTKLADGSTTGDAELIDARIGADGKTYSNLGEALRKQIERCFSSKTNKIYDEASANKFNNDFLQFPKNEMVTITYYQNNIANAPYTGFMGTCVYLTNLDKSGLGDILLAFDNNAKFYYKVKYDKWSDWINIIDKKAIDLIVEKINNKSIQASGINIYDESFLTTYPSCNDFPINSTLFISHYKNTITDLPYNGFQGTVLTYNYNKSSKVGIVQMATDNYNNMYFRSKYSTEWSVWKKFQELTYDYMKMFHKIGGVGDSLMSGELAYGTADDGWQGHYLDKYEFSWLSNIARSTGAEYKCYSEGGLRCDTWLSRWKDTLVNDEKKCNAYFIGLGTNDKNYDGYPVGTADDATGTNSFAGLYKRIIETIQENAPNAVIFCLSLYNNDAKSTPYSNMINAISSQYEKCYFIDYASNSDLLLSNSDFVSWGHFDTLGYIRVADNIKRICNKVIEKKHKELYMFGWNN